MLNLSLSSVLKTMILLFVFILFGFSAIAQKINETYKYHIYKATSPIIIDGVMDEQDWLKADIAQTFFMVTPMDTSFSNVRTEVRMTYDSENIYITAVCYDTIPGSYIVESLKRDFSFGKNDNFLLVIDPFDSRTDGFTFGTNAAGAQWDGTMYEVEKMDLSWDNKWTSIVKNYSDHWVFEAAIPFKSIRYKKGIKEWGINFSRYDIKSNEKSGWAPAPRQFSSI